MSMLPCSSKQLNLAVVLLNGQTFRWKKLLSDVNPVSSSEVFIGTARHKTWKLWRNNSSEISFKVMADFTDVSKIDETEKCYQLVSNEVKSAVSDTSQTENSGEENCKLLRDYFQLDVDVEALYADWASKDEYFARQLKSNLDLLSGIRMLKQDPLETIFAFICSANNNVARISKMIQRLCELYGTEQIVVDDDGVEASKFYDFPSLHQLRQGLSGMEQELRRSNFGYRAAYIAATVKKLSEELDGENWLMSLKNLPYLELKQQLSKLPGVGPKVADCICLMGFQKHEVVPVDTHVFQITAKFYMPEYLKNSKKTVTKKMHEDIGRFYIDRFGLYAGWAHTVLFTTRLKRFKADMVDSKKGKKSSRPKS